MFDCYCFICFHPLYFPSEIYRVSNPILISLISSIIPNTWCSSCSLQHIQSCLIFDLVAKDEGNSPSLLSEPPAVQFQRTTAVIRPISYNPLISSTGAAMWQISKLVPDIRALTLFESCYRHGILLQARFFSRFSPTRISDRQPTDPKSALLCGSHVCSITYFFEILCLTRDWTGLTWDRSKGTALVVPVACAKKTRTFLIQ